jgi:uncharacterized membrane protein YgdD (TMEM256/DUF423 family)
MRIWLMVAGLSGAMAVGMAAWAMHGLGNDPAAQELIHKGSYYQLTHALALLAAGHAGAKLSCILFAVGLILFPGTLYLLAVGAPAGPHILTPIGGMALIGGWLGLAYKGITKG